MPDRACSVSVVSLGVRLVGLAELPLHAATHLAAHSSAGAAQSRLACSAMRCGGCKRASCAVHLSAFRRFRISAVGADCVLGCSLFELSLSDVAQNDHDRAVAARLLLCSGRSACSLEVEIFWFLPAGYCGRLGLGNLGRVVWAAAVPLGGGLLARSKAVPAKPPGDSVTVL